MENQHNEETILYSSQKEILTGDLVATIMGQDPSIQIFQQQGNPQDFRRVIDLEGPLFHKRKLDLVRGIIQQKIYITHGVYYAVGAQKARIIPAFSSASSQAKIPDPTHELEVPTHVGVNVYLQSSETFCLQFGINPTVKFEIQKEPGVSYELNISNNCLKAEGSGDCPSDFQNYYNLAEVPVAQRLDIEYLNDGSAGSDRTPCDTIYLSQTQTFP